MATPDESESKLDTEKLVNRLLDIIERQNTEIARIKCSFRIDALSCGESPPQQALVNETPNPLSIEGSGDASRPGFESHRSAEQAPRRRSDSLFLSIAAVLSVVIVIIAIRPHGVEVTRLNGDLRALQEQVRNRQAVFDKSEESSRQQITALQKKLSETEYALAQNERSLTDVQASLQELASGGNQQSQNLRVLPVIPQPLEVTPPEAIPDLSKVRRTITSMQNELKRLLDESEANYLARSEAGKALAANRLQLFREQQALTSMENGTNPLPNLPERSIDDFLPADLRHVSANSTPEANDAALLLTKAAIPQNAVDLSNLTEQLNQTIGERQRDLRAVERKISEYQKDIRATQAAIIQTEAALKELVSHSKAKQ